MEKMTGEQTDKVISDLKKSLVKDKSNVTFFKDEGSCYAHVIDGMSVKMFELTRDKYDKIIKQLLES